ncbi:MAG: hypothetical protein HY548_06760 [Elusimicrobia bacterium]|nr:hypothetical protein [Elusimicrobiota bacterium]
MKRILWLCVLGLFLAGCSGGRSRLKVGTTPEGEVVEAEGVCPIVEDELSARKCAVAEAQKAALEKVLGVFLSARTRVEKAVAIEQNILAKTEGYVKKSEVIRESAKDKFYRVTVRALIPPQDVEADLKNLLKSVAVGNPRVAVLMDEVVDGEVTDRLRATQVFTETLLAKGYRVVDREVLAQVNAMASLKAIESGDVAAAANLARDLQADLLIVGRAEATFNTDQGLGGLVSYRASVMAQAVKAGTGEIVKSVSKTQNGVDLSKPLAADKARENGARLAGEAMVSDLAQVLAKRAGLTLTVGGIESLTHLSEIQKALQAMPGVQDIYTRSFESGNATFDLDVSGVESTEIASSLERSKTLNLKVKEVYKDRLSAESNPKP